MDKDVLEAIKAKLVEVNFFVNSAIYEIDNAEVFSSPGTGKEIAVDFDEGDLTNIQMSIDGAANILSNLSTEIENYI